MTTTFYIVLTILVGLGCVMFGWKFKPCIKFLDEAIKKLETVGKKQKKVINKKETKAARIRKELAKRKGKNNGDN